MMQYGRWVAGLSATWLLGAALQVAAAEPGDDRGNPRPTAFDRSRGFGGFADWDGRRGSFSERPATPEPRGERSEADRGPGPGPSGRPSWFRGPGPGFGPPPFGWWSIYRGQADDGRGGSGRPGGPPGPPPAG
ncbi:MAG: hypothetical protein RMJ52_08765, partial [Gemmataceae bacterium]|nr:hypothetical protein [Gemmataceae bacterium]